MLSAQTLNRVSGSYRRGYYAGHACEPCEEVPSTMMQPFSGSDYRKGYAAGLNDRYWSDQMAGRTDLSRSEWMAQYQH